jgi:hypothetical protein
MQRLKRQVNMILLPYFFRVFMDDQDATEITEAVPP